MNIAIETTELPISIESKTQEIYYERYVDFKMVCRPTKTPITQLTKILNAAVAYEYFTGVFDPDQLHVKEYFTSLH